MWLAVLIAGGWVGCSVPSDCTPRDFRCSGAELQICTAGGTSWHHDDEESGGGNFWSLVANCGSPDLCKTFTHPGSGGATTTDVLCVLERTPEPLCHAAPADGSKTTICEGNGTTSVDCDDGFAVARRACAACSQGNCQGSVGAPCQGSSDCAPGFECSPIGYCKVPCSCPEGAACAACLVADDEAPAYGGAAAPARWVCQQGFCLEQ